MTDRDTSPDNTGRPHWGRGVRKELSERARSFGAAHGLAVFACEAAGLFEGVELDAPVDTELVVGRASHLYPLARLLDQWRRYAVVVTRDRPNEDVPPAAAEPDPRRAAGG